MRQKSVRADTKKKYNAGTLTLNLYSVAVDDDDDIITYRQISFENYDKRDMLVVKNVMRLY